MAQSIDLIVIDGGGTGTRLRALSADGRTLATATAGPSSLTLGVDQAWRNISAGLHRLADEAEAGLSGVPLYCGLAGGRSVERGDALRARDDIGLGPIVIVTDGFASLIGAHGGRPGAVLAIGTGVAAYALGRDGVTRSASAWGFAIGDEGGGAWIGRRALAAYSRALDGRCEGGGPLFQALTATAGGDFDAIQRWLTGADATRFATLAPLVLTAEAEGDAHAAAILAEATAELALALAAVDDGGPVALLGGLADRVAPRFAPALRARITPPQGGALDGLATMARLGWRTETAPAEAARHA